ncbi:hypothetical protein N6H14_18645 [Paenibacillus sp. CC-CFT747]|nr:hypothetical protein N6H14_18645 [Paenibacillus sp. CC-CFT747]
MVILNSAVRLWVAERVPSIEEGVALARRTLDGGTALRRFQDWLASVKPETGSFLREGIERKRA